MTRGKGNRFAQPSRAGGSQRPAIGDVRNLQRADARQFNDNAVYLPNPSAQAPFDRHQPQTYEQKVYGLGLAPNLPQHFWQLIKGDAGAASSVYRRAELFQLLGATNARTAATPYSRAIQIATMRSSDQRPRYFHTTLFSVGRVFANAVATGPLSSDQILRFAAGIPAGTPSVSGSVEFGIPQFSTTKFRIMVFDESGQRFVDVDVLGTRSMSLYGFGVTVFALIKQDGYEIDRQRDDNPALGPGLFDQSFVGARIIPIRTNDTKNINNRTVSAVIPVGPSSVVIPIPPGTKRVQGFNSDLVASGFGASFQTIDPLNPGFAVAGSQGILNFLTIGAIRIKTDIVEVPNANAILVSNPDGDPSVILTFAFEVTT